MNIAFILILMIFCHIVDDYYLQGWLASAKQKSWWFSNRPDNNKIWADSMYKHDYIWALIMHGFSWAFMIMLPIAFTMGFDVNHVFIGLFVVNMVIHAVIDNMKANKKVINLWQDQIFHMAQIIGTWMVMCL